MNVKTKGNRGELELLHLLEAQGFPAVRNDQRYDGGAENPDISLPGLHIEVKRCEVLKLSAAISQAVTDAAPGTLPVIAHRRNRGGWVALMRLEDFLSLYRMTQ
jgi:Holliday junction resolvase